MLPGAKVVFQNLFPVNRIACHSSNEYNLEGHPERNSQPPMLEYKTDLGSDRNYNFYFSWEETHSLHKYLYKGYSV